MRKNGCVNVGNTKMFYAAFGNGSRKMIVLPGLSDGLETEDLLLLLILYLLYRESGDTELLVIMGAMFLL